MTADKTPLGWFGPKTWPTTPSGTWLRCWYAFLWGAIGTDSCALSGPAALARLASRELWRLAEARRTWDTLYC